MFEIIEKELPSKVKKRKYGSLPFSGSENDKRNKSTFENSQLKYQVPKSLVFPLLNSFRPLLNKNGDDWIYDPKKMWSEKGEDLSSQLIESLKTFANNPNAVGKNTGIWRTLYTTVLLYKYRLDATKG